MIVLSNVCAGVVNAKSALPGTEPSGVKDVAGSHVTVAVFVPFVPSDGHE